MYVCVFMCMYICMYICSVYLTHEAPPVGILPRDVHHIACCPLRINALVYNVAAVAHNISPIMTLAIRGGLLLRCLLYRGEVLQHTRVVLGWRCRVYTMFDVRLQEVREVPTVHRRRLPCQQRTLGHGVHVACLRVVCVSFSSPFTA